MNDKHSLNLLKLLRNPLITDEGITHHISIAVKGKQKELGINIAILKLRFYYLYFNFMYILYYYGVYRWSAIW